MSQRLRHALTLMQQLAYARILCEFHRLREPAEACAHPHALGVALRRVGDCERVWTQCLQRLNGAEFAALRVARALHLQRLLESAPARLGPWSDRDRLHDMPASHLFEWVAHDCERLELTQLEDAMTPAEAALYAHSLDRLQG